MSTDLLSAAGLDFDGVADLYFDLTIGIQELPLGDNALGLQPGIDHHHIGTDINDGATNDATRTHFRLGQALFEQFSKALAHKIFYMHATPEWSHMSV